MHVSCFSCDIRNEKSLLKASTEWFFLKKRQNKHFNFIQLQYILYIKKNQYNIKQQLAGSVELHKFLSEPY